MRVVLDTNTVVSGLLWHGAPRRVLDLARLDRIKLYTSIPLLTEFDAVLRRPKFAHRLSAAQVDISTLVIGYSALAIVIHAPYRIPRICRDPFDDEVLACAAAARADLIVTGDRDLLSIQIYSGIRIMNSADALVLLEP